MGQCNRREKPETDTRGCKETTWDSICIYKLISALTATETTYLPRQTVNLDPYVKDKAIPLRLLKLHVNVPFYNF